MAVVANEMAMRWGRGVPPAGCGRRGQLGGGGGRGVTKEGEAASPQVAMVGRGGPPLELGRWWWRWGRPATSTGRRRWKLEEEEGAAMRKVSGGVFLKLKRPSQPTVMVKDSR